MEVQIRFMEVDGTIVFFNEAEAVCDLDAPEPEDLELKAPKKKKQPGKKAADIAGLTVKRIDIKKGYQLYFYKNETTKREIDVVIQKDGMVVPIEVKGGNTRANSLKSLMKNHKDISYGYKFADGNIGVGEDGIITLPLYMIAFI